MQPFTEYTACHKYIPSQRPPAQRVAWILPPKAVKDRAHSAPIVENNAVKPGAKHPVWKTQ
jgi:hypothetical protein